MSTYAQLKETTAGFRSKTDWNSTTGNEIQNNMINVARREVYNAYPFKWARTSEDLTMSSGAADLDAVYNPLFGLSKCIDENDNKYVEISAEDSADYTDDDDYVYWIDYNTSTSLYRVNTPSAATTLSVTYQFIPADLTDNAHVDVCPSGECIACYAAAKTWLAKERDEKNHDRYMILYKEHLDDLILLDRQYNTKNRVKSLGERYDLGYTTRDL